LYGSGTVKAAVASLAAAGLLTIPSASSPDTARLQREIDHLQKQVTTLTRAVRSLQCDNLQLSLRIVALTSTTPAPPGAGPPSLTPGVPPNCP